MSWIRETLRGGMADPPPSDLRLSASWMKPEEVKECVWHFFIVIATKGTK